MSALKRQTGQATVMTVVFLTVLLAMTGAVLDVGVWFNADRKLQASTDAAALAAAQELPYSTAIATGRALEYGTKNGGGVDPDDITYQTTILANDTIQLETERDAPGVFTKLFGVDSVEVHATAKARAGVVASAKGAAPIAVDVLHPLLQCTPTPCFNQSTELDLEKVGPGAFRLLNLDGSKGGTGNQIVADWILNGYDGYMPIDDYFSDPGAKFNSSHIVNALDAKLGQVLLFPVYDQTTGGGANFEYRVIGFVGFKVTGFIATGNSGKVFGHFTHVIWDGIMGERSDQHDFGAHVVSLIE